MNKLYKFTFRWSERSLYLAIRSRIRQHAYLWRSIFLYPDLQCLLVSCAKTERTSAVIVINRVPPPPHVVPFDATGILIAPVRVWSMASWGRCTVALMGVVKPANILLLKLSWTEVMKWLADHIHTRYPYQYWARKGGQASSYLNQFGTWRAVHLQPSLPCGCLALMISSRHIPCSVGCGELLQWRFCVHLW